MVVGAAEACGKEEVLPHIHDNMQQVGETRGQGKI